MSFDYEEELERARAIRRSRKQAAMEKAQSDSREDADSLVENRGYETQAPSDSSVTVLGSYDLHGQKSEYRERGTSRASASRGTGSKESAFGGSSFRNSSSSAVGTNLKSPKSSRSKAARPAAGHENGKSRPPKNKKRRRVITVIIAEIFALLFIFGYAAVYKIYSKPQRPIFNQENIQSPALSAEDMQKMKGYWMIAIFGVDSRGSNVGAGTNADVNMIACINQDTGDIKLVSVFRDSYLNIDDKGSYNKINAAYANGGPEQAVKALNKNLDLNITDYITFNWKGVADAINILGGVDMEISKAEFRYINGFITETVKTTGLGSHHLKSAGMNHLDGVQAVAYGRLRLMDTDYARTERQRKIIQLAFDKAKKADYSVLNNILVVVLPQVATSLDFGDLTNVALNITKYKLGETAGFPMARGEANMNRKGACVVPATLEYNVTLLHQFLFKDEIYTPTETVKKISAKISSDTGIYKEGQVINHVSTEGVLPKETKAPETAEATAEEITAEPETDEFGQPLESSTVDTSGLYPGFGETDEDGNPVIGPDDDLTEPGQRPGPSVTPTYPSGPQQPGTQPSGPQQPGTQPSGPQQPGTQPSGPQQPGTQPSGPQQPGTQPSDPQQPGTQPHPGDATLPDDFSGPGMTNDGPGGSMRPGDGSEKPTTAPPPGGNPGQIPNAGNAPGGLNGNEGPGF